MHAAIRYFVLVCTLLALFLAYSPSASLAASAVTSGLTLWYDMSETGSVLADESGNGNAGTVNGAMYDLLPSGAGSREFDGYNDYVLCKDAPELDTANGMTLEVLFRPGHIGGLQTLLGKSWSSATGSGYTLWTNNADIQLLIYDRNHNKAVASASPGLNKTRWYHVAVVYDGATVTMYVNGAPCTSAACNGFSPSDLSLTIGKYSPTSANYFDGDIAVLRIYNRSLTAAEVLNNYNADQWRVTTTTHPFLLFNDISSTPGYQHRALSPWKDWEKGILDSANKALARDYTDPTWAMVTYTADNWVSARGYDALNLALAYQITKDAKYSDKAEQALLNLDVGEVPQQPNSMIPQEFKAMSLLDYSLAYDWVQPSLDMESDKAIRDKLALLADEVYGDLNWDGTKMSYITFCDFQGQAYPTLGITGVVLHDYVNPHRLLLKSGPSDWVKAATAYYFVDDDLHNYDRSLIGFEVDDAGKDMMGAYKTYYIDDLAWWAQVYSFYYQKNFFTAYPLAKQALTSEVWDSLPNGYSGDLATESNQKYAYHIAIANLLDMANRSYVLKHYDLVKNATLLPYSKEATHLYYDTELPNALYYLEVLDYSKVTRSNPPYSSHLDDDSVYQVIRENWSTDGDWLSLVTYGKDVPTYSYRSAAHHDQMSIEYYGRGDLLLADAGEDRNILDKTYGRGESSHNTIAIEDPRQAFAASSWANSIGRGIFKGTRNGIETPANVNILAQAPWIVIADVDTTIREVINTFDTGQNLSSQINYERTVLYPDRDYMILVDRLEGTETWGYRTIFRPSSLSITPTKDLNGDGLYYGSEIGRVNVDMAIGDGPYDWRSLGYKTEANTGITTSSIAWTTTNPYGQVVGVKLYSVPASEIRVTKLVGRVAGPDVRSEVLVPVVYYRTAPVKSLYRATVLLPAYANETKKIPQAINVDGNGNAMQVKGDGYTDYVYTGKGASWFASYKTDADTVFIRTRNTKATELTLINGSYIGYSGPPLIALSGRADYFSSQYNGTKFNFKIKSNPMSITVSQLDPSYTYSVKRDGYTYTGWSMVDASTVKITTGGGEHSFEVIGL